ncbi:DUF58 domain-containing protein [Microbulbifer bruguierae]|uniref:DUF58 domain-containing protein n=1 Tax=Microbulbifer bruguierae TaxID=3029061 RepID=A0ABY8NDS6_9GAMM|nr:DUF58 domain-containing protein [Microbulbifer bruguierae]WGL15588.1 DUF58 domain-containing protein [Microbulbifer bruguierae]
MRPSPLLIRLLLIACASALAVSATRIWWPQIAGNLTSIWWLGLGVLLLAALLDFATGRQCRGLNGHRSLPGNLALGVGQSIGVRLHNDGPRALSMLVTDQLPGELRSAHLPLTIQLGPQQEIDTGYSATPVRRGFARFGRLEVLVSSPWKLWQCKQLLGEAQDAKVYPNFLGISSLQALSTEQTLRFLGVHQRQRRGEGLDFRQLREYRRGDSQRQVDWRASARMQKLISREYQDERDQEIIFLLDCGRRMRARDGDLSHFDHALNALLLSAYVAIRQGDAVGLQCFAGNYSRLPPVKGEGGINLLLNHVYDLHSGTAHSDYTAAAEQLLARQQRRALVILLTNVRDEDSEDLTAAVQQLSRQHLVMVACLRERALDNLLEKPVTDFDSALMNGAGRDFVQRRARLLQQLRARNTILADALPSQMHMSLVETYWQLKRSGRL